MSAARQTRARTVDRALLKRLPLPRLDAEGDKNARGRILVVGGSARVPGAVLLAGVAALRAGAGKLQMATIASAAVPLGIAVPESLVIALDASRTGEIAGTRAARALREFASATDAVLIGPGMLSERAAHVVIASVVRHLGESATLVLDAAAIAALRTDDSLLAPLGGRAVVTPHAGEMATLLDVDIEEVESSPAAFALAASAKFDSVVALKGAESWIASPDGQLFHYEGGSIGLATSGSGDTLAGIVAGLCARGASALTACSWAVFLHGAAGARLAKRVAPVGFLARELLDELPPLLRALGGTRGS